ncbi:MAG: outer membrane protein assembly factor BamE [Rhodospirillales bacterium]|nr:MAG: outer membrane protein assembly factor BamE [Rhodospirillales bacterium]
MVSARHRSQWFGRRTVTVAVAAVAMLAVVGACSPRVNTHGNKVGTDLLSEIVPGVHSRADVEAILGSPSTVSLFDGETWYYIGSRTETLAFLSPNVRERQVVAVTFDEYGVCTGVNAFGLERGREVELVRRETPTRGNEFTFIEQIVGNIGRFEGD